MSYRKRFNRATTSVLVSLCLMLSLTACRTEIVREPVLPPPALYAECPVIYADQTIGGVLEALSGTIDCERGNNKALAEWAARNRQ